MSLRRSDATGQQTGLVSFEVWETPQSGTARIGYVAKPKCARPTNTITPRLNFKFEISNFQKSIATPCSPYRARWYCQSVKVPPGEVSSNVINTTAKSLRCAGTRRPDALPLAGEWGWESTSASNAWLAVFGL